MVAIFLKTLPFFALIGLGYWAGRTRLFSAEATAYLTKFVFFFALGDAVPLFRNLSLAEVWDSRLSPPTSGGRPSSMPSPASSDFLRGLDVATNGIEGNAP